jgi:hypothetical protein
MEAIGNGMRLRIAKDGFTPAALVTNYSDAPPTGKEAEYFHASMVRSIGPLDNDAVQELLNNQTPGERLHCLSENQSGQRRGWSQMGLDGTKADFYVMEI